MGWAAVRGRRVTTIVDGREVAGYVCGSDSYHWCIVAPDGHVWLVHKSSTVMIGLDGDLARETEEVQDRVEMVAGSFRQRVIQAEGQAGG